MNYIFVCNKNKKVMKLTLSFTEVENAMKVCFDLMYKQLDFEYIKDTIVIDNIEDRHLIHLKDCLEDWFTDSFAANMINKIKKDGEAVIIY